ncbi:hypothetical protein [Pseudomonas fluorescens]|uniref:hypothetical protein n=1 Tax=Pseudomonas fluorescens TaxID=294 RepID=UPI001243009B|nr:hypothetical protein [Pseudomonas fluorescens]
MEPQTMSLQCFRYSPTNTFPLAAAVKIACAIVPLNIIVRGLGRLLLGSPLVPTAALLTNPLHSELGVLFSSLHGYLTNRVTHHQIGTQPLTAPAKCVLANSLWLSDGYHFSQRYHSTGTNLSPKTCCAARMPAFPNKE